MRQTFTRSAVDKRPRRADGSRTLSAPLLAAAVLLVASLVFYALVFPRPSRAVTDQVSFTDVSAQAGLPPIFKDTIGAQWADYDNDGAVDFHISLQHAGQQALYHNNGDGTFTDRAVEAGMFVNVDIHGCSWGDYENDGDLDLLCPVGANSGTSVTSWDVLFRNNGDGTFTDVYQAAGMNDNLGRGRNALWLDFDKDGDLDAYFTGSTVMTEEPSLT